MSLKVAVGAPFRTTGRSRLEESEFVVALSLDRDWFSPDQAKRLVDVAVVEGLLRRDEGELVVEFPPESITIPDGFSPDESILRERTTFERILDSLGTVDESKQDSVAAINGLQASLGISTDAAAVLYAHRNGIDVSDVAQQVRTELSESAE
ncbi:DUF2240 family protein [Halocatena pleomorpha]|uniref:DUF2240 family protein n=1 Tax=Halocatena pleomorpha TaxID=1785090 RepID=A0A3P3R8H0_9EURY|nr:DUF2240 family protein [Halocatena pleomorpha]RRJ29772.1 DUF2240 family protein [Halocatena pleomorpha]